MIFGHVDSPFFEKERALLPAPLAAALTYLKETDLAGHAPGAFPLELDGVPMTLQIKEMTTASHEEARPEIHRRYIDVQYCILGGPERIEYYADDGEGKVSEDALEEKDILFYENDCHPWKNSVILTPGSYAIYFPWDAHAPGQHPEEKPVSIKKAILKVPMDSL